VRRPCVRRHSLAMGAHRKKETIQQAARAVTGVRFCGRRPGVEQFFKPLVTLKNWVRFACLQLKIVLTPCPTRRLKTARSRRVAARRSYRSSLRRSGSTRRTASADRSGSCGGIGGRWAATQARALSIKVSLNSRGSQSTIRPSRSYGGRSPDADGGGR
jgi:hypothetical protein